MKLTKTLTLAAIVAAGLLAGSTALQAQDAPQGTPPVKGSPGMRGHANMDRIAKELNLTDDQKPKVQAALEDEMTKMKDLRKDTSLSQEDKRAKAKEIRKGTEAKLKEILTPEQFKKWQEIQHNRKGKGKAKEKSKTDSSSN